MKITIRLWLLISAVAVFILGLTWLFLILLLPGIYMDRAYQELDSHADYILQMWEQSGEGDGGFAYLDEFVRDMGLHIDILTED
ncbi:MAG: hypothetical protein FWG93_08015, partial [Oscillospiraceae bacterium]|nr:hypothetical protein [Oscillospiraceae bacterium]